MFLLRTFIRRCYDLISCLVLSKPNIPDLKTSQLLGTLLKQERYEIEVDENNMVIIYIWYKEKTDIWQIVFNIEMIDIRVGYGFGDNREMARELALTRFALINQE